MEVGAGEEMTEGDASKGVVETLVDKLGPTLATSPFLSMSSISCAAGSISSSLSPSWPPMRSPSSSLPNRTAAFNADDWETGRTDAPRDWEGKDDGLDDLDALNRETGGLGGAVASVASNGTT